MKNFAKSEAHASFHEIQNYKDRKTTFADAGKE
jgi:hypothetical protein